MERGVCFSCVQKISFLFLLYNSFSALKISNDAALPINRGALLLDGVCQQTDVDQKDCFDCFKTQARRQH